MFINAFEQKEIGIQKKKTNKTNGNAERKTIVSKLRMLNERQFKKIANNGIVKINKIQKLKLKPM